MTTIVSTLRAPHRAAALDIVPLQAVRSFAPGNVGFDNKAGR